jgi:hypothetical protein
MRPLLDGAGGRFVYDFEVGRTLKSSAPHEINRLFLLEFPDRPAKERFFSNPDYVAIRARLFVPSVGGTTILAEIDSAGRP